MKYKPNAAPFTVFPTIDLNRRGSGKLADPLAAARTWLQAGARWLHVTYTGEGKSAEAARELLVSVVRLAKTAGARVQYAGGQTSLAEIVPLLGIGVNRVVLAAEVMRQPFVVASALDRYGPERISVRLEPGPDALTLARWLETMGLRWLVTEPFAAAELSVGTGLEVIAAAGAASPDEVQAAWQAGLAGITVSGGSPRGALAPADLLAAANLAQAAAGR